MNDPITCTAFAGAHRIANGPLAAVARAIRAHLDLGGEEPVLVFDDATARPIDFNLRGTPDAVAARLEAAEPPVEMRGRGRPKLGVVAREVTLLPRHWDWLGAQPGGASVALRKLVEVASKQEEKQGNDRRRAAQEAAYRFMTAMAGNLPGYEDAIRALYARERARFDQCTNTWPPDVRAYAALLAADAF